MGQYSEDLCNSSKGEDVFSGEGENYES